MSASFEAYGVRTEDWDAVIAEMLGTEKLTEIKQRVRARAASRNRLENTLLDSLHMSGGSATHRD